MGLTNEQYDQIMKYYENIQDENRHEMNRRREEAYAKLPSLTTLDRNTAGLAMQKLRARLENSGSEPNVTFEQITSRRKELLLSAGYPADFLDPIYTCKDCKDTGYIEKDLTAEGSAYAKTKCHCFVKREIELLYENSNMDAALLSNKFANLTYDYRDGDDLERLKGAVRISRAFTENFDKDYKNLLFFGTVGTGKSFLSGCIANTLIESGHSVMYFSAIGLFDMLSRYYFGQKGKETLYNFCKNLYNYDLVIIDDLGTEMTNNFVSSQLFDLINERHMGKKSTLISTNLTLEELRDRYSDRTFSRISSNFEICKLSGPDFRLTKKGLL